MTLEEIKKALEEKDSGDIYEQVLTLVETEKQTGINAKNKVNKEAKGLREQIKTLEPFKTAVTSVLAFDPDGDNDLNEYLEGLKSGEKNSGDVAELRKQLSKQNKTLEKLQGDLAEKEKIAANLKQKQTNNTIRGKLTSALKYEDGTNKLYGTDLLVDSLISNGKLKLEEDEKTIVFIDGDDVVDFDSGVKSLVESRTDLQRNQQRPGGSSGTGSPGGSNMTDDQKRLEHLRKSQQFPV